jgi:hypothetical protein
MNRLRLLLLLIAALAMPGVAATVDRDTAQLELTQAITSVQAADRDDAATYAPGELDEARVMLDSAQAAADRRDWTSTAVYAERAKMAGDLAASRSRQHRAEAATAEIERNVETLRRQLTSYGGAP